MALPDGIDPECWNEACGSLRSAQRVVAFTGAGISQASGIATFRDPQGVWNRFPPEEFAHWQGLTRTALLQPRRLAEFLLAVLEPIAQALPNAAHAALTELEQGRNLTIVTQNIDGLHQAAGSSRVLEVHGSMLEIVDAFSGKALRTLTREELADVAGKLRKTMADGWTALSLMQAIRPLLGGGLTQAYRPNLTLFGDAMAEPAWTQSLKAVRECDVLLCIGTSGTVQPAAGLPQEARDRGASVITIDPVTGASDCWLKGNAEVVLPSLVSAVRTS